MMRGKSGGKSESRESDKGVSVLVGFILLMMISMLFLSVVQTFEVPKICEKYEAKAMQEYVSGMSELASESVSGNAIEIELPSVSYPNYLFLLTPSSSSYSLSVRNVSIHLSFQAILPNGSVENESMTVVTKRINLTPGFYYYPKEELTYECTALFKKAGRAIIPEVQQRMVLPGVVNVVGMEGREFSVSSNSPQNLILVPVSSGSVQARNVRVSFSSFYPEYWEKYGANVSGNTVSFTVPYATLNFRIYRLEYGSQMVRVERAEKGRVLMLGERSAVITQGEAKSFGVEVVNEYFQPISGVDVKVSVSNGIGSVYPSELKTGYDGKAVVNFVARNPGSGEIVFSTPYGNVSYKVTVRAIPAPSSSGPLVVRWQDKASIDSYYGNEWNATKEGISRILNLSVTYSGQGVPGVTVNIANTNSSVVSLNATSVQTNAGGVASVEASARNNGSATLIAYIAGSYDVLNLSVTGVPNNPLLRSWWNTAWKYRVPINISYSGSSPLYNYQVLVTLDSSFDWSHVSSNASDIRFTDSNGKLLPYWIEYWDYGYKALIWVNVSRIDPGTTTIYMYYGNSGVKSESDGYRTFVFFDDFSVWKGWNQLWSGIVEPYTFNGQPVLKKDVYDDPNGGWKSLGTTLSNFRLLVKEYRPSTPTYGGPYDRYGLTDDSNNGYFITRKAREDYWWSPQTFGIEKRIGKLAVTLRYTYLNQPADTWYITELTKYNDVLTASIAYASSPYNKLITVKATDNSYNKFTRFEVRGGHPYYIKWIAVAKYTSPEPIPVVGSEQSIAGLLG